MSAERERELVLAYRSGDAEAGRKLVGEHLRYAVKVAYQFARGRHSTEDLIQQANIGLILALEGFDPSRGARFLRYATYWINLSIRRWLLHAKVVHLPLDGETTRVARAYRTCHPSTVDELAEISNVKPKRALDLWPALSRTAWLDAPTHEPDSVSRVAMLAGDDVDRDPFMAAAIERAMIALGPRAYDVIYRRLVLEQTLQHIANHLGCTRERVRQIEQASIEQLRKRLARVHQEAA